jgi:hypothetical protein
MKSFKQYAIATFLAASAGVVQAQEFSSAYFLDGVTSRHEQNPAFGNDQNYFSFPALGSLNLKLQGNFGVQDILFKNPQSGYYNRTFMHPDVSVSDALSGFNKGANKITEDVAITFLSMGFQGLGGYNTIELKTKSVGGVSVPYELFEFANDLKNKNYEFDDIRAKVSLYTELAFGHSHQVSEKLRVGAKVKLLFGHANADLTIEDMTANLVGNQWVLSSKKAEANVNMKGITFKNKVSDYKTTGTYEHVDLGETDVDNVGVSGFGLGLDIGAQYEIIQGLKVSAAVKDIGFISWSNNHLLKQRSSTFNFNGFHDVAIKSDDTKPGETLDDKMDGYADQLSDFMSLSNEGDTGGKTTSLAATVCLGGEYTLPMYEPLTAGLLFQQRINGPFSWTEGRISANWKPLSWLNGGLNFGVNTFGTSAGWIVNFHPNGFNFFVGMDHIFGKMTKEMVPLSSNASFSMGIAFTWGGSKKEKRARTVEAPVAPPINYDNDYQVW